MVFRVQGYAQHPPIEPLLSYLMFLAPVEGSNEFKKHCRFWRLELMLTISWIAEYEIWNMKYEMRLGPDPRYGQKRYIL